MAGRPPKKVDMDEVKHMLAFDFHLDEIADTLDVSSSTLYRRLKVYGIEKYSDISDADLDYTIQSIKEENPNDGEVLGGESVDVWRLMSEEHQSTSAVITVSSTHNERIERFVEWCPEVSIWRILMFILPARTGRISGAPKWNWYLLLALHFCP